MWEMYYLAHVIFHYFIVRYTCGKCTTCTCYISLFYRYTAGVVCIERLLLHKGDVNNVLHTTITYRMDIDIVYRVLYRAVCIAKHWCIVPALVATPESYN